MQSTTTLSALTAVEALARRWLRSLAGARTASPRRSRTTCRLRRRFSELLRSREYRRLAYDVVEDGQTLRGALLPIPSPMWAPLLVKRTPPAMSGSGQAGLSEMLDALSPRGHRRQDPRWGM